MIDPQISEWASQILRWIHVVTAIAWIGSSFYFVHLDLSLKKRPSLPEGVGGEAWQVHGGGFYNMRKYVVAPEELPQHLTWFKWESYATWISGFFLLSWIYYLHADLYTIDPSVRDLSPWQAAALGMSALAAGWMYYNALCRSPLGRNNGYILGIILLFSILGASYFFFSFYNGRAAYIHIGALIATWMSGNVFFVIIPNQKKVVASLLAGETPDPRLGQQAKQRSTHNNYLTLPVLFLMLSSHSPMAWSSPYAVLIVGLVVVAGAVLRRFFNFRHANEEALWRDSPWWTWGIAVICLLIAFWLSLVDKPANAVGSVSRNPALFEQATLAIQTRCSMCHAAEPAWEGLVTAPKGILLDTPEHIARRAEAIEIQSVLTHSMPPNNITQMTAQERDAVAAWLLENRKARPLTSLPRTYP